MSRRFISGLLILFMVIILFSNSAFAASLLKVGSSGNDVKAMQQKLIELGYLNGKADGIYGHMTRDAVVRFQQAKGLSADGIAGPNTLNALYGTNPPHNNQKPPQNPSSETQPSNSVPTRLLKSGSRGEDVKQLQSRLNQLGFSCGAADGIFGNGTRNAVINFQRANGLAADGIAGPATLGKLFKDIPPVNENPPVGDPPEQNPSNPGSPGTGDEQGENNLPPITQTLKRGSRGQQVKILQDKLNGLGYSVGIADGIFGAKTQNAVIAFQKDNGLAADGIVGSKTIEKLYANTPSPPPEQPEKPEDDPDKEQEEFHGTPGQLAGKTVILDPGHGGWDVGANRNGIYEKDLNLDMAKRLKRMLQEAGATVVMTRTSDQYYSLYYRAAFANKYILDHGFNKKVQEKEAMEEQHDEKIERKIEMEEERLKKLARMDELQRSLPEKETQKLQAVSRINVLLNNKLSMEQDWEIKDAQHQQKITEQEQATQELDSLTDELADLDDQKSKLEVEIENNKNERTQLEGQYQAINDNIMNLEHQISGLKEQMDSPDVDPETKKQLQQQYDVKKAQLDSLNIQRASNEQLRNQITAAIKSKELGVTKIAEEISDMKSNIAVKESRLNSISGELKAIEALAVQALQALEDAQKELNSAEQELDSIKEDIDSMEEELSNTRDYIDQLEKDIPALQQELLVLEADIQEAKKDVEDLKNKGELFRNYLNNPSLNDRQGIYETDYDSVRGKNHINKELGEIFDLVRSHFEDDTIFIAIHCNSTVEDVTNASGVQAYYRDNGPNSSWGSYGVNTEYYQNYNARKREELARALLSYATKDAGFSGSYSSPYKQDFAVLRETNLVSVLMEIGFINNPDDRQLLTQEKTRENVAKGMYKGIVEYFR